MNIQETDNDAEAIPVSAPLPAALPVDRAIKQCVDARLTAAVDRAEQILKRLIEYAHAYNAALDEIECLEALYHGRHNELTYEVAWERVLSSNEDVSPMMN